MCSAHTWRVFSTEFVSGINNRLTTRLKKKLSVNIQNAGRGNTMLHVTMLQVEILQCYMLQSGRNIQGEPGNQVPMKCISSSEFFGMIHATR